MLQGASNKKKVDNIDALVAWGIDHGKMRKHSLVVGVVLFRRLAGKAELHVQSLHRAIHVVASK